MTLAGIIIASAVGAALIASGVHFFREDRRARGRAVNDNAVWGDVPRLHEELAAPRLEGRAGSGRGAPSAAVDGLHRTHSSGGF